MSVVGFFPESRVLRDFWRSISSYDDRSGCLRFTNIIGLQFRFPHRNILPCLARSQLFELKFIRYSLFRIYIRFFKGPNCHSLTRLLSRISPWSHAGPARAMPCILRGSDLPFPRLIKYMTFLQKILATDCCSIGQCSRTSAHKASQLIAYPCAMTFITLLLAHLIFSVHTSAFPFTRANHSQFQIDEIVTGHPHPSDPMCIDSPAWVTSSFLAGDCLTCIDKLHNREVDIWSTAFLEFFSYRTQLPYPPSIWAQRTPRKYRYKSCTLAIVMLKDMPEGVVPGRGFPGSDLSSYAFLEMTARNVLIKCMSPVLRGRQSGRVGFANPTGFDIAGTVIRPYPRAVSGRHVWSILANQQSTGRSVSIGVFFWDTNSQMNQQIPASYLTPTDPQGSLSTQWLNATGLSETKSREDVVVS